ncbi:hypothetical protein [Erwinia tasmaniensis]|uniref:hypothetical protein n=1 Tax=Erwinia tasmaniensis TaxID=338565 RepID=UPI003A4D752E
MGEAAISLLSMKVEINMAALLGRLAEMGENEEDDERLLEIWATRRWLQRFRQSGQSTEAFSDVSDRVPRSGKLDGMPDFSLDKVVIARKA